MKVCSRDDCEVKHYARGLCKKHYGILLGELNPRPLRICQVGDCDRTAWSGKYCGSHQKRHREGRMGVPIRRHNTDGCEVVGCNEPHYGGGMCQAHYVPARKRVAADDALKNKYDIGIEQRDKLLEHQGGLCGICGNAPPDGKALVVDHDHSHCGGPRRGCRWCVRGMLCSKCNLHLGRVEDAEWLDKALAYLNEPPAYKVIPRPRPGRKPGRPFADVEEVLKELGINRKGITR